MEMREYLHQNTSAQLGADMVDLLLAPIVNATVSKVIVVASEQFNLAVGWKGDLERFCHIMEMLQAMLQDADRKNVIGSHSDLKPWLLKLRAIVDEADDVLEDVAYENLRRQFADRKWKKVRYFFTLSNPLLFSLKMDKKVKSLNSRLADINVSAAQLGLQSRLAVTTVVETIADPRQTNSFLPSQVVGREEDVSLIESLLINDPTTGQDLPVIAIVGMPGLGKTTLTKAVCKSNKIREKFGENVLWVSVSGDFEHMEILKKMLESVGKGDGVNVSNEEAVMRKLQGVLGDKSYLLILDGVWNEERHKWESLRGCLLGLSENKGNRVLVTTRSKGVALVMALTEQHILFPKGLLDDECWIIIKQRVFGCSSVAKELEEFGVEIARKCQGIPLVASLIGATLQNRRDRLEGRSLLNQGWHSLGEENGIFDIIKTSYDRLPELALKQCFAFCSIFPKGSVMRKDLLIQLWMAMGLLRSSKERHMEMEDIGDKYFRCLLSFSLFQEEQRDRHGMITSCRMHDLIHDFAESISNFETVILKEDSGSKISGHVRHLNFTQGGVTMPSNFGDIAPNLQTLFSKQDFSDAAQTYLKRLRILDLSDASDVKQLQTCLGDSKSLRYLDISGTKLEEFPKFIKRLYNLQTFRFMNCRNLKMPLEGLCNLINLRHIYFSDEDQMPANLGRLTNLQTLQLFFVGTSKGRRIEELGSLSKLKGRLEICKLERVEGKSEAERAKLHEKAVEELALIWSVDIREGHIDEDILDGLQPHPGLQRLKITYFGGENLPSWMLKSMCGYHFDSLRELQLQKCRKLKSIPVMEGFKSLRLLFLEYSDELTDGAFAFPSLEELSIRNCQQLETLTISGLPSLEKFSVYNCGVARIIGDDLSTCPCLKVLNLEFCYNLEFLPSLYVLSSLENLTIWGNEKLMHLPSGLSSCTALETLTIEGCENLVSISEELKELCSLVELRILDCTKLSSFPEESLGFLTSLKTLSIGGFSNELQEFPGLGSIHNLHASLEDLWLYGWENLTQLPHQITALTSLNVLEIHGIRGVEVLPEWLGNLTSLTVLSIIGCQKVKSFPEAIFGSLTCLKSLEMGSFAEDLGEFIGFNSIHHLHGSLKELTLRGWKKLTMLPHQIQHLTALEGLHIWFFTELEGLPDWLGDLPSLQNLHIKFCKNLKHLPSAKVIKRLSRLDHLYMNPDWPELKEKIQQLKESTSRG